MRTLTAELELALNERPVIKSKFELLKSFKEINEFSDIRWYYKSGGNATLSKEEIYRLKEIAALIEKGDKYRLDDKRTVDLLLSLSYNRLRKNSGMRSEGLSLEKHIELNMKKYSKNTFYSLDNLDLSAYESTKTRILRGWDKWGIGVQVYIPKDDKSLRELIISSTVDRWVQGALELPFKIKYESLRDKRSYGYIRKVSKEQVINDWLWSDVLRKNSTRYIIEADVKNCFPSIPHAIILKKAADYDPANYAVGKKGRRLLKTMLETGYLTAENEYIKPKIGTPQGNVWSPVLANIVMGMVDDWVNAKEIEVYARFADDFIIGCKTLDEAQQLRSELSEYVFKELGLVLNAAKTVITDWTVSPISFLGYNITYDLDNDILGISPDIKRRLKSLKQKLIISSDSNIDDIRFIEMFPKLNNADKMDKLTTMWTPILQANVWSDCDAIIKDLISKHYIHVFSEEDWYKRVEQENILFESNIAQLFPHLCITKNAYNLRYNSEMEFITDTQEEPVTLMNEVSILNKTGNWLPKALEKCALSGGPRPRILMHKNRINNKVIKFLADNVLGSLIFDTDEDIMNYLILTSTSIYFEKRALTRDEVSKMLSDIIGEVNSSPYHNRCYRRFYDVIRHKLHIDISNKFIIGDNFICFDSEWLKSILNKLDSTDSHIRLSGTKLYNQFYTWYYLISFILHFILSRKKSGV